MPGENRGNKLPAGQRATLIVAMVVLTVSAIAYTVAGIGMDISAIESTIRVGPPVIMPGKVGIAAIAPDAWSASEFLAVFLIWWAMMAAMMVPAASASVVYRARLAAELDPEAGIILSGLTYLAGYLGSWACFSAGATVLQWGMEQLGMVSPSGLYVTHNLLAGGILTAAGIYQFSQLKHDCLTRCRRPERSLAERFRPGLGSALSDGFEQGLFSLRASWFLMAMLFYGGIMNLYCILGIALLVQVEHWLPRGESIGLGVGSVLILWGVLFLVSATGVL